MRRRPRKRLRPDHLIGRSLTPVYMVTPDRRISFFNEGCQTLTGWSADEMVGQLCEFVTERLENSPESLAACLCPPAAAFEGRVASLATHVVRKEGEPQPRTLNFIPLMDEEGAVACVLGVIAGAEVLRSRGRHRSGPRAARGARDAADLFVAPVRDQISRVPERRHAARRRAGDDRPLRRGSPVLIWGERGSGKEHLARAIHYESTWRTRAFIPLDCQSLSPLELGQTLKRLLFPSAEDTFPSALAPQPGTLYLAHVELLAARRPRRSWPTLFAKRTVAAAICG